MGIMNERTGGKRSCKYYDCCGTTENCAQCKGHEPKWKLNIGTSYRITANKICYGEGLDEEVTINAKYLGHDTFIGEDGHYYNVNVIKVEAI